MNSRALAKTVIKDRSREAQRLHKMLESAVIGRDWIQSGRVALVECAQAAARTKDIYLASQYARIKGRHRHNKTIIALAHSILAIAYHVLQCGQQYTEPGADYFIDRQD